MESYSIVIFGATGDLAKRKLLPALYELSKENIPFILTLVGRKPYTTEEYMQEAKTFIEKEVRKVENNGWNDFTKKITYFKAEFESKEINKLQSFLKKQEQQKNIQANRIYYLATMPEHFPSILKTIKKQKMDTEKEGFKRIVFEKPFGSDLKSATTLNNLIKKSFKEIQVYRTDHYLTKETIENILVFRCSNTFFDPIWNKKYIDHIEITVAEDMGIESRGKYYDKAGVIRDMIQNHLLQILTLITMECPKSFERTDIQKEKINILKKIKITKSMLGQYNSYKREPDVKQNSTTPTYIAIEAKINNPRWKNIPCYLRTGKKLKRKTAFVYIKLKENKMTKEPNEIVMHIQPEQDIVLYFNTKKPGSKLEITKAKLEFCYQCLFGPKTIESYQKLITNAIHGDQSNTTSWEETKAAWKIVAPILKQQATETYQEGSWGPNTTKILKDWFIY